MSHVEINSFTNTFDQFQVFVGALAVCMIHSSLQLSTEHTHSLRASTLIMVQLNCEVNLGKLAPHEIHVIFEVIASVCAARADSGEAT